MIRFGEFFRFLKHFWLNSHLNYQSSNHLNVYCYCVKKIFQTVIIVYILIVQFLSEGH